MENSGAAPSLDLALLAGFSYGCRPDCGLCCYAEPLVAPGEQPALIQLAPDATFVERGGGTFLRAVPDGGACRLLHQNRCRVHAARPSVCREFPVTVHVGERLQATVVLTCPGVDLASLDGYLGPDRAAAPRGFEEELAALRARVGPAAGRAIDGASVRRRRIVRQLESEGRWQDEGEVRGRLRERLPRPANEEFPVEDPPSEADGIELLPLVFASRTGPIALAAALGGWELLELSPGGGAAQRLGIVPPPDRAPAVSAEADRLLEGYLRYWLERDALFGVVHLAMLRGGAGTVADWVDAELRRIGAVALSRARVLATARRGIVGPLSADDLAYGIRATDQDLLDQTTWGSRL